MWTSGFAPLPYGLAINSFFGFFFGLLSEKPGKSTTKRWTACYAPGEHEVGPTLIDPLVKAAPVRKLFI